MIHNFEIEGAWNIPHAAVILRRAIVVGFHRRGNIRAAMSRKAPKNLTIHHLFTLSLTLEFKFQLLVRTERISVYSQLK